MQTLRLLFAGDLADHLDELELFRKRAVGEIEAGDIEAGAEQFAKDGFAGGGRPQRGDNLGAAQAVACEAASLTTRSSSNPQNV